MANSSSSATSLPLPAYCYPPKSPEEEQKDRDTYRRWRDLYSNSLAVGRSWKRPLYRNNEQPWYGSLAAMVGTSVAQQHFIARSCDVLVVSFPKSGSTWIKALLFAIMNRAGGLPERSVFSPHQCVPFLELQVYSDDRIPDLGSMPSPRLFATHIPFTSLPRSVLDSGCRIVYLCRDPRAAFVSLWHFARGNPLESSDDELPLEEAFEMFCDGFSYHGPYWDHALGYWKAATANDDECDGRTKVLFLKYEDLMEDTGTQLRRIAEFVGMGFTDEEEGGGVVQDIVELCSFKNLSESKAGKVKVGDTVYESDAFLRKGKAGDWVNYLTPEMCRRLDQITADRFSSFGLTI